MFTNIWENNKLIKYFMNKLKHCFDKNNGLYLDI